MEDGHQLSEYPLHSDYEVHMQPKESGDIFAKQKQQLQNVENTVDTLMQTSLHTADNLDN